MAVYPRAERIRSQIGCSMLKRDPWRSTGTLIHLTAASLYLYTLS